MPFVFWINRAVQMIKTYCKSLGLKQSQLNLYEALEENWSYTNPYSSLNNHDALILLTEHMKPDSPMDFFSELEEGKHLKKILQKTLELKQELQTNKINKREQNFDTQKYFKFLESLQTSGLPVNKKIVEEAKVELKKERWIKKFNDLQQAGNQGQTNQVFQSAQKN